MKIKSMELVSTVIDVKDMPKDNLPQIVLAGRSHVGKSSFINTLAEKKIAKISSTPGKTRTINFYKVNNIMYLVDLPGYGYAKASRYDRDKWAYATDHYLKSAGNLAGAILIVDIRHKPTKDDMMMCQWILSMGYQPYIVANKADKLKKSELNAKLKHIAEILKVNMQDITPFSSRTGMGKKEISQSEFFDNITPEY